MEQKNFDELEFRALLISIMFIPLFIVVRFILGYFEILIVDIVYLIYVLIYYLLYRKNKDTKTYNHRRFVGINMSFTLLGMLILSAINQPNRNYQTIAGFTYLLPAIIFLIIMYILKKRSTKQH